MHWPARKEPAVTPVIFLGDGKGNWRRWTEARFPRLPYDYGDVAVGDFNGDGRPDIALGVHLRGMIALVARRPGGLQGMGQGASTSAPSAGAGRARLLVARRHGGRLERDGRPDIVAVGEGPRPPTGPTPGGTTDGTRRSGGYGLVVYLNQGDGTWVRKDQGTSSRESISARSSPAT